MHTGHRHRIQVYMNVSKRNQALVQMFLFILHIYVYLFIYTYVGVPTLRRKQLCSLTLLWSRCWWRQKCTTTHSTTTRPYTTPPSTTPPSTTPTPTISPPTTPTPTISPPTHPPPLFHFVASDRHPSTTAQLPPSKLTTGFVPTCAHCISSHS